MLQTVPQSTSVYGPLLAEYVERTAQVELPHPIEFAENHGIKLWGTEGPCRKGFDHCLCGGTGQLAILHSIANHAYTVIYSGADLSKTFTLGAILVPWWLTRPDSLCVITSGTYQQLKDQLWEECRSNFERYEIQTPPGMAGWEAPGGRRAVLRSTKKQAYFTGFHAQHVMVLGDEGHGLPRWLYKTITTAIGGTNPNHRIVIAGNPIEDIGPFVELGTDPEWNAVHLSQLDYVKHAKAHGRIAGMDLDLDAPEKMIAKFGADDPWVSTYVYGVPPKPGAGVNVLFSQWMFDDAVARERPTAIRGVALRCQVGIDVASRGSDRTVAYWRIGDHVRKLLDVGQSDADHIAPGDWDRWIAWLGDQLDDAIREQIPASPQVVAVDCDGPGDGLADILTSKGHPVVRVHFGALPPKGAAAELYYDMRGWGYWHLSQQLREADLPPAEDKLRQDLLAVKPTYKAATITAARTFQKSLVGKKKGFRTIVPKDEIKESIGRSPDNGDAAMLTYIPLDPVLVPGKRTSVRVDPEVAAYWKSGSLR